MSKRIIFPTAVVLCAAIVFAQATGHFKFNKSAPIASSSNDKTVRNNQKSTAGDPWAELEHLFAGYQKARSIVYEGTMKLTDEEGGETIEEADFSGEVQGKTSHYIIDSVEFIHEDNVSLNVYHREKLVVAGTEKLPAKTMWQFANIDSMKSFVAREGALAEVDWDKADKVIKVTNTVSTDVYGYEIYYSPQDYRLKKMVLHFATLDNLGENPDEEGGSQETTASSKEKMNVAADSTSNTPSIEFNLYKLEFEYKLLSMGKTANKFEPLKKYGQTKGREFHLNNSYPDYRVVWMDKAEKNDE
ncbi:hypothetical protein [Flavisolibacter nicotianae]|uniref:hypothetical protein n=1 Tax=Flavisolibacter nicotianae TaxID=2364882 RepID=UPI000EB15AA9|nr:hypothetical protein [Flavisolibacter nicotianae]